MSVQDPTIGERAGALASQASGRERHPRGLPVLFATEMWERFGFYTMLAMLTLYMRDPVGGFGWSTAKATSVYSWYQAFVYATPLVGGWLADRFLGSRRAVITGGFFFMAGYLFLAVPSVGVFYAGLVLLVMGNGFFKPNVSAMVGNLYPEGSRLKDRGYLIFYMGINIGAFLAPIIAEIVKGRFGFNPAFAVAAGGMVIALSIMFALRRHVIATDRRRNVAPSTSTAAATPPAAAAATGVAPLSPAGVPAIERIPEWKRIGALIVIFAIVIVFWMIFHQNGSTLTFWANDNTDWRVTGIISNAINPFWIVTLALPLAWFWGFLDRRGLEPSTPVKIACGMVLTGVSLLVLYFAALSGGYTKPAVRIVSEANTAGEYFVAAPPREVLDEIGARIEPQTITVPRSTAEGTVVEVSVRALPAVAVQPLADTGLARIEGYEEGRLLLGPVEKVSPWWLILAYFIISLGELMLSPMGLALVSKVAPVRMRGVMMGGWFLATAIGNKLTAIGGFWDIWSHATFFVVLASMAFAMAVVLFLLIRPLKRAMPGV